jgi:hypothetical protein
MSHYLTSINSEHIDIKSHWFSSQTDRLKAWYPFLLGEIRVFVAAIPASSGIETVAPVLTIYPNPSEAAIIRLHQTHGDVLFFFTMKEQLKHLRYQLGIAPIIIF